MNQKLGFEIGKATELIFLSDEPKTGTSEYGAWYCYTVRVQDQQFSLFPPESLHQLIQQLGIRKDDRATITKLVDESNGHLFCYYVMTAKGQTLSTNAKVQTSDGKTVTTEVPTVDPEEKRKQLGNLLYLCLLDACQIARKLNEKCPDYPLGPTEIEKLGVALWLSLKR